MYEYTYNLFEGFEGKNYLHVEINDPETLLHISKILKRQNSGVRKCWEVNFRSRLPYTRIYFNLVLALKLINENLKLKKTMIDLFFEHRLDSTRSLIF